MGMTDVPMSKPKFKPAGPSHPVTTHDGPVKESAQLWWWVFGKGGTCGGCSASIAKGQPIAFRASDKEVRCQVCVDAESLLPRESKRFKQARAA